MTIAIMTLARSSIVPLHRQLYESWRDAILSGRFAAGARLPSTRALAAELAISRNTVLEAYAQLMAEGYVEGQIGSGTYVAHALPDDLLYAGAASEQPSVNAHQPTPPLPSRSLSRRGALLASTPVSPPRRPTPNGAEIPLAPGPAPRALISFRPGQPAIDAFPYDTWARIANRHWRHPPRGLAAYGDPAGYAPLREMIAAYLRAARAIDCDAGQVIVVSGSQQALDLAARVLLDEGDPAWIEDPGYLGARGALIGAGARIVPVPVDHEGLDVTAGAARCPDARLAYVSPSHQYPLGVTMSLARRLALLEWAARAGAWVLEDDYDSEYRYAGRPLAALQGLDRHRRVIYIGTFSKVLFPALRLGYMVVPLDLVDAFVAARALADRHSSSLDQAVLADFIAEGHFTRHIRRMRALYAARHAALVEAVERDLAGLITVIPAEAGMHLVGWLPEGAEDRAAAEQATAHGVDTVALSLYALEPPRRGGLLLGYTALDEAQIREGVRRLAALR